MEWRGEKRRREERKRMEKRREERNREVNRRKEKRREQNKGRRTEQRRGEGSTSQQGSAQEHLNRIVTCPFLLVATFPSFDDLNSPGHSLTMIAIASLILISAYWYIYATAKWWREKRECRVRR